MEGRGGGDKKRRGGGGEISIFFYLRSCIKILNIRDESRRKKKQPENLAFIASFLYHGYSDRKAEKRSRPGCSSEVYNVHHGETT